MKTLQGALKWWHSPHKLYTPKDVIEIKAYAYGILKKDRTFWIKLAAAQPESQNGLSKQNMLQLQSARQFLSFQVISVNNRLEEIEIAREFQLNTFGGAVLQEAVIHSYEAIIIGQNYWRGRKVEHTSNDPWRFYVKPLLVIDYDSEIPR